MERIGEEIERMIIKTKYILYALSILVILTAIIRLVFDFTNKIVIIILIIITVLYFCLCSLFLLEIFRGDY